MDDAGFDFGGLSDAGMGLSTDLGKGLFDRFRSLPIWPPAPFAGLIVGDVLRHLIAGRSYLASA